MRRNWLMEKVFSQGLVHLTDTEVLEILLMHGTGRLNTEKVANDMMLHSEGKLQVMAKFEIGQFSGIPGISVAKATLLAGAFELGRRRHSEQVRLMQKITASKDVFALFHFLGDQNYESFWVLYLNKAGMILGKRMLSTGAIGHTVVDIRLILAYALEMRAYSIVLVHNHPSGVCDPSESDRKLTIKIQKGARFMDINLLDHIIITQSDYYSFADYGELH